VSHISIWGLGALFWGQAHQSSPLWRRDCINAAFTAKVTVWPKAQA